MRKIFLIATLLILSLIATTSFAAAAKPAGETSIVKAMLIGPEGKILTVSSNETGEATVQAGDRLILMGQAKKEGKEPLSFNLFAGDSSGDPVVTQLFKDKAKKQAKTIHYTFTPIAEGQLSFIFNVTNNTGAELSWARINITVEA